MLKSIIKKLLPEADAVSNLEPSSTDLSVELRKGTIELDAEIILQNNINEIINNYIIIQPNTKSAETHQQEIKHAKQLALFRYSGHDAILSLLKQWLDNDESSKLTNSIITLYANHYQINTISYYRTDTVISIERSKNDILELILNKHYEIKVKPSNIPHNNTTLFPL